MATAERLLVAAAGEEYEAPARALADRLTVPYKGIVPEVRKSDRDGGQTTDEAVLLLGPKGLSLCGGGNTARADLTKMIPRLSRRKLATELLVRAAGVRNNKPMTAIDATAGFGEDSLLLAAAGMRVTLFEYDPVIAELLADALRRAAEDPVLAPIVCRMELRRGDSVTGMAEVAPKPDVILLDPMFPERTKTAAVKKKFQLLHLLEAPCADEEALFAAAEAIRPRRLIVKRPVKGAYLAGRKPDYSIAGKAVRYDCFVYAPKAEENAEDPAGATEG